MEQYAESDNVHVFRFEMARKDAEIKALKQQLDQTRERLRELAGIVEDQSGQVVEARSALRSKDEQISRLCELLAKRGEPETAILAVTAPTADNSLPQVVALDSVAQSVDTDSEDDVSTTAGDVQHSLAASRTIPIGRATSSQLTGKGSKGIHVLSITPRQQQRMEQLRLNVTRRGLPTTPQPVFADAPLHDSPQYLASSFVAHAVSEQQVSSPGHLHVATPPATKSALHTDQRHDDLHVTTSDATSVSVATAVTSDPQLWELDSFTCTHTMPNEGGPVCAIAATSRLLFTGAGMDASSPLSEAVIRVWDLNSLQLVDVLRGHCLGVRTLLVTARLLFSGGHDNVIKVWNLETLQCVATLSDHEGHICALAYNGLHLFSGSADHSIRVWDMSTMQCVRALNAHARGVTSLAIHNRRLYSGGADAVIHVWDLDSLSIAETLKIHARPVWALLVHDELLYSASADGSILAVSLNTLQVKASMKAHGSDVFALSAQDARLFSASGDRTLRIWDTRYHVCTHILDAHHDGVWSLCVAWGGRRLFSGSLDRTIKVWQRSAIQCINTLQPHKGEVRNVAVCGDELLTCGDDHLIVAHDLATMNVKYSLRGHHGPVYDIKCSEDGHRLFSASYDHTIMVWDLHSVQCVKVLKGHKRGVRCLLVLNDRLYSGSYDNTIRVWDLLTKDIDCVRVMQDHGGAVSSLCLHDNVLLSGSGDGSVRAWDLASHRCLRVVEAHKGGVNAVASAGHFVFSAGSDGIKVWDPSFVCIRLLSCHRGAWSLLVSGGKLCAGCDQAAIKVVDVLSLEVTHTLSDHKQPVTALLSYGRALISASRDMTVRIFE
eukprot:TRINITY_DN6685_c0_g1_i1.p1 TRINITY_DN6685_c0_g1~~TRINITY_DN6685_c0_g1_i1.p1  ORF type:complete len:833 (+),score=150.42 TRINITY_DN6685_c0_g1_i1:188-2686(+)